MTFMGSERRKIFTDCFHIFHPLKEFSKPGFQKGKTMQQGGNGSVLGLSFEPGHDISFHTIPTN